MNLESKPTAWYSCMLTPRTEVPSELPSEHKLPSEELPSAEEILRHLAPKWLAGTHSTNKLSSEMVETACDLAALQREDLRELGFSMVEAAKVLTWAQVIRRPECPVEPLQPSLVRLSSDVPISPWPETTKCPQMKTAKSTPSMSPWAESKAEELRLDEIEGQVDFWVSCFASGSMTCTPSLSTSDALPQEDVRENILEAFFDCTPERIREVFISMDTDSDGHVTVEELRMGLERCGISGFDNETLAKVFQHVTGTGRKLHLQAFETILCRLRLASLLMRPWRAKSLSVMDFDCSRVSDFEVTSDNMCQFFFGHRLCTSERHSAASPKCALLTAAFMGAKDLVRWVHMASFDIHLLFALTVKYTLHPLSVEDVIEQCQTKIDRLGGHYFLTIELLTLVDAGDTSKGLHPVRVRGQHVAAFCSGPPQLDTLITVAQADRKFSEEWPGGAPEVEVPGSWVPRMQQRLRAARSRLRERRADALLYALVDLCADELVAVTRAFFARLTWLEEDLRIRGNRSLLDLGEVSLAQLQLAIVARRLRSLQRVVRRASEYQDLHTTGSADYWRDCTEHLEEAYEDTLQMKERCDALKSAHEAVIERGQAEELQMQHDEQAAQAKKMNHMLFFLTVGSTIFTPVTFMSSVYGMNFESSDGVPTIPFLLEEYGYTYFWYGVLIYFMLAISFVVFVYQRFNQSTKRTKRERYLPCCGCCNI